MIHMTKAVARVAKWGHNEGTWIRRDGWGHTQVIFLLILLAMVAMVSMVSQRGCMPVILFWVAQMIKMCHMAQKKKEQGGNPSPVRPK